MSININFLATDLSQEREIAIEVRNLSKSFYKRSGEGVFRAKRTLFKALNDISLTINKGEIYGILGSNGSGKSTLIRAMSTLLIPDSGSVSILGLDALREPAKVRRLLNRVSVDAAFYKKLSAKENLGYSARLYGLRPVEAAKRTSGVLKRLGMAERELVQPLEELSRGQQQKISIARAFQVDPIVVMLDEPTTGLDPKSRLQVQEFVLELRARYQATVVLTTHDMPEAERLCDRIAFIRKGEIVAEGTSAELQRQTGAKSLDAAFVTLTGDELA